MFLNATWVAAEFAIVRVRRTRLEELAGQGVEAAKHAIVVVDRISDYLALTQIGITVASLAVGWIAEDAVAQLLGLWVPAEDQSRGLLHMVAFAVAFTVVSVLHVVLGEQVPKLLAVMSAERYVLFLARPLRIAHLVARPLLRILERMSTWIVHCLKHGAATHKPLTEAELKLILEESHKGGVITDGEAEIIVRAFEFVDKQSEEIMIPAVNVCYLSLERSMEQNLDAARKHMHARLPLCRSGLDSVIGTVSMKDVWPLLEQERSNAVFERVSRPPIIVTLDSSQEDILRALRKGRGQMGIVRDLADKRTLGIVTLEDVLESLVGDVREAKLRQESRPAHVAKHRRPTRGPSGRGYATKLPRRARTPCMVESARPSGAVGARAQLSDIPRPCIAPGRY
jgi:CBS domain containing-hemolysin-like protein